MCIQGVRITNKSQDNLSEWSNNMSRRGWVDQEYMTKKKCIQHKENTLIFHLGSIHKTIFFP